MIIIFHGGESLSMSSDVSLLRVPDVNIPELI